MQMNSARVYRRMSQLNLSSGSSEVRDEKAEERGRKRIAENVSARRSSQVYGATRRTARNSDSGKTIPMIRERPSGKFGLPPKIVKIDQGRTVVPNRSTKPVEKQAQASQSIAPQKRSA